MGIENIWKGKLVAIDEGLNLGWETHVVMWFVL